MLWGRECGVVFEVMTEVKDSKGGAAGNQIPEHRTEVGHRSLGEFNMEKLYSSRGIVLTFQNSYCVVKEHRSGVGRRWHF